MPDGIRPPLRASAWLCWAPIRGRSRAAAAPGLTFALSPGMIRGRSLRASPCRAITEIVAPPTDPTPPKALLSAIFDADRQHTVGDAYQAFSGHVPRDAGGLVAAHGEDNDGGCRRVSIWRDRTTWETDGDIGSVTQALSGAPVAQASGWPEVKARQGSASLRYGRYRFLWGVTSRTRLTAVIENLLWRDRYDGDARNLRPPRSPIMKGWHANARVGKVTEGSSAILEFLIDSGRMLQRCNLVKSAEMRNVAVEQRGTGDFG
jgi:hypothetical protein